MEISVASSPNRIPLNDRIKLALKFFVVGIVFYFLFEKGLVTENGLRALVARPEILGLCVGLITLNAFLGTFRWALLVRAQGIQLGLLQALRLNFIGVFFNIALPGTVSGDVVKALEVGKVYPDRRGHLMGSILFDRILGVAGLAIIGAGAAFGVDLPAAVLSAVFLALVGSLGFFGVLFLVPVRWMDRVPQKFRRILHGIWEYQNHPRLIGGMLALSVVIHAVMVLVAFLVFHVISTDPLPIRTLASIVPIGMLATAIPVLPAGVGTGHAAFIYLFSRVGSPLGADVFSWIVFFQVIMAAIGGVVYLWRRHTRSLTV